MTDNRWASPAGYEQNPPTVRYRIRECLTPYARTSIDIAWLTKAPPPTDYELGKVVERTTQSLRDDRRAASYLSLNAADQLFADLIAQLVQQACGYFYLPPDEYEPLEGVVFDWCGVPHCGHALSAHRTASCATCERDACSHGDCPNISDDCRVLGMWEHDYRPHAVSDDEVRERIHRLDKGENTREAERTSKRSYPISELPWDQQRALIEQVERLKRKWAFEIIGEVEESPSVPVPTVETTADWPYHETPFTDGQPVPG